MSVPETADLHRLLDQLDQCTADDLESEFLDFKPWQGPKEDLKLACEYAACFANAAGGVLVFGVGDRVRGRAQAIHGARGYDLDIFVVASSTAPGPVLPRRCSRSTCPRAHANCWWFAFRKVLF